MIITNKYNLPQSIVNAVSNDTYAGPRKESKRISVSTIKDSPRIHFLKIAHWDELTEDVSEALWKLLGQATHAILERAEDTKSITEERVEAELDGITISGQMDILQEHRIEDYKTTSAWSVIYNPNGKKEWEEQLNIYRWLASKKGFDIKELVINAILRDHQSSKAKSDPTYPQIPFVTIKLPVWPLEQTEAYLKDRIAKFKACMVLKEDELPPCTSEEMWEKEGSWAIMKAGRKTAVKVCSTELEAKNMCAPDCQVVYRPGTRNRCADYCPVAKFCNIYKSYQEGK